MESVPQGRGNVRDKQCVAFLLLGGAGSAAENIEGCRGKSLGPHEHQSMETDLEEFVLDTNNYYVNRLRRRESFKRLINIGLSAICLLLEIALFAYMWQFHFQFQL